MCLSALETTIGRPEEKDHHISLEEPGLPTRQATLLMREGSLFFTNLAPDRPAFVNGAEMSFSKLKGGDEIRLGEQRLLVKSSSEDLAVLEGYTEPHRGKLWPLGKSSVTIGRGGRRPNVVELEDRTVSREQASVLWSRQGFVLHPETRNSPILINGDRVTEPTLIKHGDLLQLGQQLLRFRSLEDKVVRRDLLPKEATILFSDIWNYSTFAESRPLEETILQMNEFYAALGKVIEAHQGILLTFLGDAMMAVFGTEGPDPDAPRKAVDAALSMQARLKLLNEEWESVGKPPMTIGVGINTGEVMVGDVGFTGKFEFAAMGDNTNLAARIEKLTREFDAKILISESTQQALDDTYLCTELGQTKVKGRDSTVRIFRIDGRSTNMPDEVIS